MNMFDEARAISGMLTMKKMKQSEIAKIFGTSQSYVANKIRLLKLPESARRKIVELGLTERHARALLRIKNEDELLSTIDKISDMKLGVAASEALIDAEAEKKRINEICFDSASSSIERFEEIITRSVKSLKSVGIETSLIRSYHGQTKYITISLKENG